MTSHIYVKEETIPKAWEKALLKTWYKGDRIKTEYDKPEDPESRDVTAMIVIENPQKEPRIHKAFPGSLDSLEIYRQEVLDGVHDYWVCPEEGKWSYTYHQRLFAYDLNDKKGKTKLIDQINGHVIPKLVEAPHTRRAQAIVWKPDIDPIVDDPACLQRMWFRIFGNKIRMNVHMRSNDAFKAGFMNMWAFSDIQRYVAEEVSIRLEKKIIPGIYTHLADSFHIYGSYFNEFEEFLESCKKRKFKDRVWDSTSPLVQAAFETGRAQLKYEREHGR